MANEIAPKYRKDLLGDGIAAAAKDVTTAGTAEALAASSTRVLAVVIRAKSGNTDSIYVGASDVDSTDGFPLAAGEAITLNVRDLADVYVDAAVNGEGVHYIAETVS